MMRDSSGDQRAADSTAAAIVTVCWCGTAGILAPATTQVGLFFMLTAAQDISHSTNGHGSNDHGAEQLARILSSVSESGEPALHLKMGFDGCGQTNGCTGTVFASGLTEQCRCVVQRVEQLLTHFSARGQVVLNVLGLSRGGIAAMKLAQMLAMFDPELLCLNLCLFDPVPGNLLITATLDHFLGGCLTTARQCIDLGASANLRRCLAIYPYVPLPSCAFHAPIVPHYPALTEVTELVTLECHQGAFFQPHFESFDRPITSRVRLAGVLSFLCVSQFLESCGTVLQKNSSLELTAARRENILAALEQEASTASTSRRSGHGHGRTVQFVRHVPSPSKMVADASRRQQVFLNEQHFRLVRGLEWFNTRSDGQQQQQHAQIDPETRSKFLLQKEHGRPLLASLCCCI